MNKKYKLIATDFDGTLVRDDGKISPKNKDTLKKQKEQGYITVAVTGRTLGAVEEIIDLNTFTYLILDNGAYIYDIKRKKIVFKKELQKAVVKEITEELESEALKIDYCSLNNYYRYKIRKINPPSFIINIDTLDEIKEEVAKINITLKDNKNIETITKEIGEKYNLNTIVMQDSNIDNKHISISPKNIDKKESLEKLGEFLQVNKEEMIFFGDGLNDLEIMEWVGCGVAVKNAFEVGKEKANYETESNNNDGVALFLEKL